MTLDEAKQRFPPMWAIYDHPKDFPDCFVARLWYGEVPSLEVMQSATLPDLIERVERTGCCVPLGRFFHDDPCIVGVWI